MCCEVQEAVGNSGNTEERGQDRLDAFGGDKDRDSPLPESVTFV